MVRKEGVEFREFLGEISFSYIERPDDETYHEIRETIPENIVKQGEKAIKEYANKKIERAKNKWKKQEAPRNILISSMAEDGTHLEGRIVKATGSYIYVELDKPVKGKSDMHFSGYAHMAGHHVFEGGDGYKISKEGYEGAQQALCNAYREVKNKPKRNLVERLNKK